ncbi:GIY-YIG nuclease family protein [Brevundimonas sp. M20]|uniref:GIY-YIG nuclease family protein n=1 Tax=Brevundimonas sp. M20 TaxID=2591463 RepID=UPI00114733AE|nr:GIY-YIG nuclease family protein [Brevundimonas sp. M20]QDH73327.1 GIY-YIG nuclease family protein [Brevundimonas sp. M20]
MGVSAPILLSDIWPLAAPATFKIHFSRWNRQHEPLDVWVNSPADYQTWQEYRPARDEFNRPRIFSLARFYHEPDIWLFTGIFDVLDRKADQYVVSRSAEGSAFIGRLKIRHPYRDRSVRLNFENHYPLMQVSEVLAEPYSGRAFPGFDGIDLSFAELENLARTGRADWMAALSSIKGIYLISDVLTGKRYVGSAYGQGGVWSRWCEYAATGHGNNAELRQLVTNPNLDYVRKAFRFALLEHRPVATPDQTILDREGFWKTILLTRGAFGNNRN